MKRYNTLVELLEENCKFLTNGQVEMAHQKANWFVGNIGSIVVRRETEEPEDLNENFEIKINGETLVICVTSMINDNNEWKSFFWLVEKK